MSGAMTSMASLLGSSNAVLEGSLQFSGSTRLSSAASCTRVTLAPPVFSVRAQQMSFDTETSRRAVIAVVAGFGVGSFARDVLAAANSIKIGPPPPPSGGLRKIFVVSRSSNMLEMLLLK